MQEQRFSQLTSQKHLVVINIVFVMVVISARIIVLNMIIGTSDQNYLFLKDLNLNFWRREVSVEVEATLSDGHTLGAPGATYNDGEMTMIVRQKTMRRMMAMMAMTTKILRW